MANRSVARTRISLAWRGEREQTPKSPGPEHKAAHSMPWRLRGLGLCPRGIVGMTALWCGWLGQSNSHERREGRSDVSAGRVVRTCTLASCLVVAAILALALPAASESRIPEKLESRIVDLGTLPGGWYSYANGINDVAQIVGYGNI